jgi:hypothetical protein
MILTNWSEVKVNQFDWYDFSLADNCHRVIRSKANANGQMAMEIALVKASEEEVEWFKRTPRHSWHLFRHELVKKGFYN